jgi:hypothetical protein
VSEAEKTPEEILGDIWQLTATGLVAALSEKPSAALLNVALKFLTDSGVSLESLRKLKQRRGSALGDMAGSLPVFTEGKDGPAPPSAAAASHRFTDLDETDGPNN